MKKLRGMLAGSSSEEGGGVEEPEEACGDEEGPEDFQTPLGGFVDLALEEPTAADLLCSLTGVLMRDPVRAEDGFVYERKAILEYFEDAKGTEGSEIVSPMLRTPMGTQLTEDEERRAAAAAVRRDQRLPEGGWAPHGLQPEGERRAEGLASAGGGGSLPRANKALSDALGRAFTILDPMRDLLASCLDGWEPPRIVVVGDESTGKSTLLEQLAMLPVFPRKKRFCTRMAIHLRLRRDADLPALATLSVQNAQTRQPIGETKRLPAGANGYIYLQEAMDEVLKQEEEINKNHCGIITSKILVLEVRHPAVASIDLIDLPGITRHPADKEAATQHVLAQEVQFDNQTGKHAMYLAVVPASGDVRPNTNSAMCFIEKHGLQSRSFGVFSKTDQLNDVDVLRALVTGENTPDGESPAELGGVPLEKGWIATMLKKPSAGGTGKRRAAYYEGKVPEGLPEQYFDVHNLERLHLQRRCERDFFAHEEADPVMRELYERGSAGVGALVERLEEVYNDYLHSTWMRSTLMKVMAKLEASTFELNVAGKSAAHGEDDLQQRAADALRARLEDIVQPVCSDIITKFVLPLREPIVTAECSLLTDGRCHNPFSPTELDGKLRDLKRLVDEAAEQAIDAAANHLKNEIHDANNGRASFQKCDQTGKFSLVAAVNRLSHIFTNGRFKFFETGSLSDLYQKANEEPPFPLCNYEGFVTGVGKELDKYIEDARLEARDAVGKITARVVSHDNPLYRTEFQGHQIFVRTLFPSAMLADMVCSAFMRELLKPDGLIRIGEVATMSVPIGTESKEAVANRERLEKEVQQLTAVFDGLCDALSVSDEELEAIRAELTRRDFQCP
mmetsp:Transcript_5757/g.20045  ORF Transcript_5757/g.20045 Transcript_5757/m.20045 type:complete len:846 (-) Transcript_5757:1193-3730(-)